MRCGDPSDAQENGFGYSQCGFSVPAPGTELSPRVSSWMAGAGDLEGRPVCTLVTQRPGDSIDRGAGHTDPQGQRAPRCPKGLCSTPTGAQGQEVHCPNEVQGKAMLTRRDSLCRRLVMNTDHGGPAAPLLGSPTDPRGSVLPPPPPSAPQGRGRPAHRAALACHLSQAIGCQAARPAGLCFPPGYSPGPPALGAAAVPQPQALELPSPGLGLKTLDIHVLTSHHLHTRPQSGQRSLFPHAVSGPWSPGPRVTRLPDH